MGTTILITSRLIGPRVFDAHMIMSPQLDQDAMSHAREAFREAGAVSMVTGSVVALVVALVASWRLNRRFVQGLEALREGARQVADGHYDQPVLMPARGHELATVATEFNKMAATISATDATRRAMLTDLGHELRTPLAATRAILEAIQDRVLPADSENIETLLTQNQRLTALATDISEVSRAEEGRYNLNVEATPVDEVVRASVRAWIAPVQEAGITLITELDARCLVALDPTRMGQVVDNLLSNAYHHTPPGGQIRVTSRCEPPMVITEIADTGSGIDPEVLPHVFERFFRDDRTRVNDPGSGTGVGLAISRAIVSAHGGTLDLRSDGPGFGTTAVVELPVLDVDTMPLRT